MDKRQKAMAKLLREFKDKSVKKEIDNPADFIKEAERIRAENIQFCKIYMYHNKMFPYQTENAEREIRAYEMMTPEEVIMTEDRYWDCFLKESLAHRKEDLERLYRAEKYAREHPPKENICYKAA